MPFQLVRTECFDDAENWTKFVLLLDSFYFGCVGFFPSHETLVSFYDFKQFRVWVRVRANEATSNNWRRNGRNVSTSFYCTQSIRLEREESVTEQIQSWALSVRRKWNFSIFFSFAISVNFHFYWLYMCGASCWILNINFWQLKVFTLSSGRCWRCSFVLFVFAGLRQIIIIAGARQFVWRSKLGTISTFPESVCATSSHAGDGAFTNVFI